MATMISEVYDALLAAGSPEEKARKAAEAVASYDNRLVAIENRLVRIESEMAMLCWMVGFGLALNVAILARLFLS